MAGERQTDEARDTLQLRLLHAVDDARALPPGSIDYRFLTLCRTYLRQIEEAVVRAR